MAEIRDFTNPDLENMVGKLLIRKQPLFWGTSHKKSSHLSCNKYRCGKKILDLERQASEMCNDVAFWRNSHTVVPTLVVIVCSYRHAGHLVLEWTFRLNICFQHPRMHRGLDDTTHLLLFPQRLLMHSSQRQNNMLTYVPAQNPSYLGADTTSSSDSLWNNPYDRESKHDACPMSPEPGETVPRNNNAR